MAQFKYISVFTAFSGYDSQCLGLERLKEYAPDFDYELVGWAEIDANAIKAHNALFPQYAMQNHGDISKIEWSEVPDFDLFTYSSPCQDFSAAGKQRGAIEGSGTRSSLLWECRRCIDEKRPKFLLFENVAALMTDKFYDFFINWQKIVDSYGYTSYYKVLSAKDYGIPQNRERLFMVSIRNDVNIKFTWPASVQHCPHLYELLEKEEDIDPKLFRSKKRLDFFMEANKHHLERIESDPINHTDYYDVIPCGLYCHTSENFTRPPLYDTARTLKSEQLDSGIIYKKDGIWKERIFSRKECFRLMGLTDEEFSKIEEAIPYTAQGKTAGNSIVVNVLFHIFRKLFIDNDLPDKGQQYTLF